MLPNSADLSEPSVARAREGAPRQCCGIWRSLSTRPRSWLRSTGAVVPSSPRTGISLKWYRRRWPAAAAPSRRLEPVGLLGAAAADAPRPAGAAGDLTIESCGQLPLHRPGRSSRSSCIAPPSLARAREGNDHDQTAKGHHAMDIATATYAEL